MIFGDGWAGSSSLSFFSNRLSSGSGSKNWVRERRRRLLLGGALLTAIVFLGVAWFAQVQRSEAQLQRDHARMQLLAIEARRASAGATTPDYIERAGGLALESIEIARKNGLSAEADAIETARSALTRLPLLILKQRGGLSSLVVLPDGSLSASRASHWPATPRGRNADIAKEQLKIWAERARGPVTEEGRDSAGTPAT